jgi:hypothetical protein
MVAPASSAGAVIAAILPVSDSTPGRGRDVCSHGSIHESDAKLIVIGVSSYLPWQIQNWFALHSDMIPCSVLRLAAFG